MKRNKRESQDAKPPLLQRLGIPRYKPGPVPASGVCAQAGSTFLGSNPVPAIPKPKARWPFVTMEVTGPCTMPAAGPAVGRGEAKQCLALEMPQLHRQDRVRALT